MLSKFPLVRDDLRGAPFSSLRCSESVPSSAVEFEDLKIESIVSSPFEIYIFVVESV